MSGLQLKDYMAILIEVEMGVRKWGDSTPRLEQQIVLSFPLKRSLTKASESKSASNSRSSSSSSGKGKGIGLWFFSAYQKKECSHTETHSADLNGKLILAHHICASCWLKDKIKVGHPDSSTECPYFEH